MAETFKNFIGGEWVEPSDGQYFENRNPARQSDLIGMWPRSGKEDVDRAAAAAKAAFDGWRLTPAPERGAILKRVGDLLVERKDEIARAATREMGKVWAETKGDVQEGIDTAYYAATMGRQLFGHTVPSELRNKWAMSYRRPIGVCGLITPFNFPLAIPTWKMFPALVCGNTVVIKPGEDVPHTVTLLVEILDEAGIPKGVVNLVHGFGDEVGAHIVSHPDIPVISFTGSTETGKIIGRVCGEMHKRLSLEMGGKNAQIVLDDADMELALDGVLWGAFGTTGQRCTATSRLILQDGIHDRFVERLTERAKELKLGYGNDDGVDVGPLINADSRAKVEKYVEIGKEEGTLVIGGERACGDGLDDGFFFQPTIFTDIRPGSRMATEEIFGPVLSVIRVKDADEAFRINNEVKYGLAS
ncbi:MAG TPA: aldehyde dehydrogenase family protein [Longimicrobiaceae bacterium]